MSMDSLSNFFEKQLTQHHSQDLLGLSRALFPTTFLEVAYMLLKIRSILRFSGNRNFVSLEKKLRFSGNRNFGGEEKKSVVLEKIYILQRNKQELNELRQTVLLK